MRSSDSLPTRPSKESLWHVDANDVPIANFLGAADTLGVAVRRRTEITPDDVINVDAKPQWGTHTTDCVDESTHNMMLLHMQGPLGEVDTTDTTALVDHVFNNGPTPPTTPIVTPPPVVSHEWVAPVRPYTPPMPDTFLEAVQRNYEILVGE